MGEEEWGAGGPLRGWEWNGVSFVCIWVGGCMCSIFPRACKGGGFLFLVLLLGVGGSD